jgi:hypothetical protein
MNNTAPKRKPGRPRNPHTDEIAKQFAVTKRQAQNIAKEIEESGDGKDEMKAERLRKIRLECARLEHLLEVARGKYVLTADVEEEARAVGLEVKAKLRSWTTSLPGRLEGLTAAQMTVVFDEEVAKVLAGLSNEA